MAAPAGAATAEVAPSAGLGQASTTRGRYEFLDALRGIAATTVVVQHAVELVWPAWARFSLGRFRPGEFGVILFFLCSGFIIPASLERHGSQSRFWIGRFFRLYPLYWFALAAALALHFGLARYPLEPSYLHHPLASTAANATMAQDFLGASLALGQSWSLAYELAFYGMVSALFVAGWHRRSARFAVGGFLLAMVPLLSRVPGRAPAHVGPKLGTMLALIALGAGAAVAWAARRAGRWRWPAAAIAVAVAALVANRPENLRTACLLFATLFTGTVLYRWSAGQLATAAVSAVLALAALAIVVVHATTDFDPVAGGGDQAQAEIVTYLAANAVFVVALMARRARFPRALLYLGTISYSLYLDHSLAIYGIGWLAHNGIVTATVWIGVSVVTAALTYRFIERPAIDVGHRVGARWGARPSPPGRGTGPCTSAK